MSISYNHPLEAEYVAKPWGRRDGIKAAEEYQPLGEVIYNAPHTDLIVKWLQTNASLSVQVHPQEVDRKHEWWYITNARPGSYLHLGLKEDTTADQVRESALDGSLPDLLNKIEPKAGDSFYVEAGTIHALGPGLDVVEVQEPSTVTWRLFDYGRPRELHLDESLRESILTKQEVKALPEGEAPFRVKHVTLSAGESATLPKGGCCVAIIRGDGTCGEKEYNAHQCWEVSDALTLSASSDTECIIATPCKA